MASKFRIIPKIIFYTSTILYPLMIFYLLVIRKTPIRMLSLFVMAFALLIFITGTSRRAAPSSKKKLNAG